ncbi:cytochrome-c peroxidase [Sulfurimonas sp.]|uniref:cytochrome-c peroxidase n=1 Tax=Sulfurimonas sp. TaxID=2022749 RepID=UPI00356464DC
MKYIILILLTINLFSLEDLKLVELAYKSGLKPVAQDFETLLKDLNSSVNDLSKDKIILGKKLFFDKNLSLNKDISCASCHNFNLGGADAKPTAIGHKSQENPFHLNTPTVLNTAFSKKFFWDGRSETLENQAKGPLQAPFEMSITPPLAEKRISENKAYINMFKNAFSTQDITFDKIAEAISSYEKTLVTRGRYDDFLLGYFEKLSQNEKDGMELFITKGCVGCHNGIGFGGQAIRKFPLSYHTIWSMKKPNEIKTLLNKYNNSLESQIQNSDMKILKEGFSSTSSLSCDECHKNNTGVAFPFENIGGFTGSRKHKGYFRVPLLRNVVKTGPYFHNGEIKELKEAVKMMGLHQLRIDLSDIEIEKIISFFKSLNGEIVDFTK